MISRTRNGSTTGDGPGDVTSGTFPKLVLLDGSSKSSSISSCSSRETVRSVGEPQQPEARALRSPTGSEHQPENGKTTAAATADAGSDSDSYDTDEVFSPKQPQMAVMSPLVNRWRRMQAETSRTSPLAAVGDRKSNDVVAALSGSRGTSVLPSRLAWRPGGCLGPSSPTSHSKPEAPNGRTTPSTDFAASGQSAVDADKSRGRLRSHETVEPLPTALPLGRLAVETSSSSSSLSQTSKVHSPNERPIDVWLHSNASPTKSRTSSPQNGLVDHKPTGSIGGSVSRLLANFTAAKSSSSPSSSPPTSKAATATSGWNNSTLVRTKDRKWIESKWPPAAAASTTAACNGKPAAQKTVSLGGSPSSTAGRRAAAASPPSKKFDDEDEQALSPIANESLEGRRSILTTPTASDSNLTNRLSGGYITASGLGPIGTGSPKFHRSRPGFEPAFDSSSMTSMTRSAVFTSSELEDRRTGEINRLRQDLKWAKDQVQLLTSRLCTNQVGVVEAFDQSLCNMAKRLDRLAASAQFNNCELSELQATINSLRQQNWSQLHDRSPVEVIERTPAHTPVQPPYIAYPSAKAASRPGGVTERLQRQTSSESVSSVTSATSGISSVTTCTEPPDSRQRGVKNWLRSSFGKAFSRRKRGSSVTRSADQTDGNMSHTCSMPTISDQQQWNKQQHVSTDLSGSTNTVYGDDLSHLDKTRVASHQGALPSFVRASNPTFGPLAATTPKAPMSLTTPRRADVREELGQTRAHKRSESLDQKLGALRLNRPVGVDSLKMNSSATDGRHVSVSVITNADHASSFQTLKSKQNEINIGAITVGTQTTWIQLDAMIRRTFQDYLIKLDPATSIGLSAESVHYYNVGEVCRRKDHGQPELLPIGYLIGDVNTITIGLKGGAENALDQLSFELLIPKLILQRYVNLLVEHRRVIFSGSTGTGKSFLAQRLAEFIIQGSGVQPTADTIAVFQVDNQSSRELRQYLTKMAGQCAAEMGGDDAGSRLPIVVILDNLHRVTSLSDVFNGFLSVPYQCCPYVIGTMNQTVSCSAADLQMHHNFRWVLYANHIEPVRSFLGRYLRRQLTSAGTTTTSTSTTLGTAPTTLDKLSSVVEWLPKVWQRINRFLESHSSSDITIGPRLFLSCPMDFNQAEVWFADLWNYSIVPYLLEAVREGIQSYGCRGPWEELADWVTSSYPWRSRSNELGLLRLRAEDVGYPCAATTGHHVTERSQMSPATEATHTTDDSLSSVMARLQEAALRYSDHESDSDASYHGDKS